MGVMSESWISKNELMLLMELDSVVLVQKK
jgi:hypothetical protein